MEKKRLEAYVDELARLKVARGGSIPPNELSALWGKYARSQQELTELVMLLLENEEMNIRELKAEERERSKRGLK